MTKYIIGIDEAGRGPLAGPVAVGAVLVPHDFPWELIPGVADSKKLSEKKREEIYTQAKQLHKKGMLRYSVVLISARVIDTKGISYAVQKGIAQCLKKLAPNAKDTTVKLDGLLHAPEEFTYQRTIVKGDATEKEIGLASIMAKVTRDRKMCVLAERYPEYSFEVHKGYGTLAHRKAIRKHGLSDIHRTTFCRTCQ